ncbi:MAG: HAD family hydrolase, partial [Candidatus Lokiarchaeia archaeon]|nr:HAD family hydrolase [Candidatus Lokiarchaeia archaeon]
WYNLEYWFNRFKLKTNWKELLKKYRYAIETFPEVPDILDKFYNIYDMILISNAKREFIDIELEESKLKKYFSFIFSSTSDFNMVKKVSDFYLMICNKLSLNPNQIIHIGDHEEFDYKIPKKIGINSFYLNREKTSKGKFVVYNLQEFFSRVENFIK